MIVPRRRSAAGLFVVEMRQIFVDLLRRGKVAPSEQARAPAQSPHYCRNRSLLQPRPPRNSLRVKDFPPFVRRPRSLPMAERHGEKLEESDWKWMAVR